MKTKFASWVILFQETLEYMIVIDMCYGRQVTHLQAHVPNGQIWAIVHTMIETLLPVENQCILNQSNGFWLLSDALVDAFTLVANLQKEVHAMEAFFQPLVQGDFDSKLQYMKHHMMG